MGADHSQRAFDELAIARFALAQGHFRPALDGDVDAGGDDEVDSALLVEQRRGRPRDAAQASVTVQPVVLECAGSAVGAHALEVLYGGVDVRVGDELVPEGPSDQAGEVVSAGSLAGAIEADDAAGGVEDGDQGVNGIKHGGYEVALHGECGLDALAGAGNALHLAQGMAKFDRGHRLPPQHGEGMQLKGGEPARGDVEDKERSDAHPGGRDERSVGIKVEGAASQEDPSRSEGGMLRGVGNLVYALAAQRRHSGQTAKGQLGLADAAAGVDPDSVGGGEGDPGDGGVADLCG